MNKPSKCKNCQWYGKPYWSIINPCDSCPNENDYKTIITIDREPVFKEVLTEEEIKKAMTNKSIFEITIEEKDKEIERLSKEVDMWNRKYNEQIDIINKLEKTFVNDDKRIKEYNIEHPGRPLDNYSRYYLDKLKELKEGKE